MSRARKGIAIGGIGRIAAYAILLLLFFWLSIATFGGQTVSEERNARRIGNLQRWVLETLGPLPGGILFGAIVVGLVIVISLEIAESLGADDSTEPTGPGGVIGDDGLGAPPSRIACRPPDRTHDSSSHGDDRCLRIDVPAGTIRFDKIHVRAPTTFWTLRFPATDDSYVCALTELRGCGEINIGDDAEQMRILTPDGQACISSDWSQYTAARDFLCGVAPALPKPRGLDNPWWLLATILFGGLIVSVLLVRLMGP